MIHTLEAVLVLFRALQGLHAAHGEYR